MISKKIVLLGSIVLLATTPFVAYHLLGDFHGILSKHPNDVSVVTENLPVAIGVNEQAQFQRQRSSNEVVDPQDFDLEQFFFGSSWRDADDAMSPEEAETLLSFLVFLEVFQEFGWLPHFVEHRYFRQDSHKEENSRERIVQAILAENPELILFDDVLSVHDGRIRARIDLLRGQSLEETFIGLLEHTQYHYPGYVTGSIGPHDIETILSTRSFLKVFQEFSALPHEQAIEKLHVFNKEAIEEFSNTLETFLELNADPSLPYPQISIASAKYTVCVSMLLAARMGEQELIFSQIDEMRSLTDSYVERSMAYVPLDLELEESAWMDLLHKGVSLDEHALLTVLMHALNQSGKDIDLPFEVTFNQKSIPLYQWDAPLTHYDFEVWRGGVTPDPQDLVEHFVVYGFMGSDRFDEQKKQLIIDTLKAVLSE